VTRDVLGATSWGAAGAKVLDHDGDGKLDLLVTDMHSDMWMPPSTAIASLDERRKWAGPEGGVVEMKFAPHDQAADLRARFRTPKAGAIYGTTLFRALGGGRFDDVSDRAG